ncbi:pyridoxamine 5'-phosphate oxidase family protein [Aminivibrio sp.]|uniref:pyridoxamine 5'-phosphate oxidase family protein n=1 Tax=Aminivibrio sp. TaxID=1872489 RepID=UPI00345ECE01|nr:pyridoxamine 5'-phosphate oxidase family protein [Synergistales bacterium]
MGHPVRRKDREITEGAEMYEILDRAFTGHLALCSGGEPYVVPLCFGVMNGAVYFHCAREGRKLDILARNPRGCFQAQCDEDLVRSAERPCGWGMLYKSVMMSGPVTVVEDEQEKAAALLAIMKKYAGEDFSHEFSPAECASVTVLRLDPEERSGKARRPA